VAAYNPADWAGPGPAVPQGQPRRPGGGGLYWLVAGGLLSIVTAVFNARVLLVEIIR
jgi:hypothetical protein